MSVAVVDLLEMVDVQHQDRHSDVACRVALSQDTDLTEKIRAVVKPGKRIANRSFKHLALKPLIVRIETHKFEHEFPADLNAVAVFERHGPVRWNSILVHEGPVRAAQVSDLGDPIGTDFNLCMPA